MTIHDTMDRNLRLYPVYQGFRNAVFWIPVFFLYFSSVLPPAQVLLLEAVYYLAVVVLEVPSGYFSDRIGRRATLVISALTWGSAGVLFVVGGDFLVFAVAQGLLAIGMAFNSGTDSALLYESLLTLDRKDEIGEHEARAQAVGFRAAAGAAIVGGAVAGVDLRLAYVLSALAGVGALIVALRLAEPPRDATSPTLPPLRQILACGRQLGQPVLLWTFVFAVAMTVFNHIPYEFVQPWIDMLLEREGAQYDMTPLVAGVFVAITALTAAWIGRRAPAIKRRIGTPATLLGVMALQGAIIVGMSLVVHWALLALIVLRSVPRAVGEPVMRAEIHPRIGSGIRATYLSMQSLVGRLAFSICLAIAAAAIDESALTFELMAQLLQAFAIAAGATLVLLAIASWLVRWERTEAQSLRGS